MDSHDYNVFTGVKIEIFFMGFDQIFSVNNEYVNKNANEIFSRQIKDIFNVMCSIKNPITINNNPKKSSEYALLYNSIN